MRLTDIECRIEVDRILEQLDISYVIDGMDLSAFDEFEAIDDLKGAIVERVTNSSAYNMITVELDGEVYLGARDLARLDTDDLIEIIEDEGYTILSDETLKVEPLSGPPQNLFESLCNQFDLPRAATTKQQLLTHINSLL